MDEIQDVRVLRSPEANDAEKKEAATALANLADGDEQKTTIVAEGGVPPLIAVAKKALARDFAHDALKLLPQKSAPAKSSKSAASGVEATKDAEKVRDTHTPPSTTLPMQTTEDDEKIRDAISVLTSTAANDA